MDEARLTPMIRQYLRIKEKYRDCILFFRLGDFYEMFFEDAEKAARILDIALTSRNRNDESPIPLCGVPYHAAAPYIGKLLEAGHKVAICEQVEDPKAARGVVQREVVRVVSPGTVTDGEALDARSNNFLVAVARAAKDYGLAVTDVTTGEFRFTLSSDPGLLIDEIGRIGPSEIILEEGERIGDRIRSAFPEAHVTLVPGTSFSATERLKSLGLWSGEEDRGWEAGIRAAAAIVCYLEENLPEALRVLMDLRSYSASQHLMLDETTTRNLELIEDLRGDRRNSLLGILDYTLTAMGARRLRHSLLYPLLDERAIAQRQDAIEELVENYRLREELTAVLEGMQDLERLSGRVASGSASPRDLVAIKESLRTVSRLREKLRGLKAEIFASLREALSDLPELIELVERAIVSDPPPTAREGGFIRTGFSAELDELRSIRAHAKEWLSRFEASERKRTGIGSLKVGYTRVFGYYIEVTKPNLKLVPPDYARKQTLLNAERYVTPELKEHEAKILASEEEGLKLELSLFGEIRERMASDYAKMRETSRALADLDALVSLAEAAHRHHFTRPRVNSSLVIRIRAGRHPVVEKALGRGAFVPNDADLDPDSRQILVLTGPNMAGKSTYMRQVALIVIMAQMGSFVPAAEAEVGLVDRIFTRIGAQDALARGESTFMVEMKETAQILRHATHRSLILLDEVGRGTSTFDGISIAWSVAEGLHDLPERPRTLFATHYHELTELAVKKARVRNFNFAVKEWNGNVIFLRSLVEGAASRSYGIQVARLAGLPASIIERAKEILRDLDGGARRRPGSRDAGSGQMSLFAGDPIRDELRKTDVTLLSPIEALNTLHRLAEEAKKEDRGTGR